MANNDWNPDDLLDFKYDHEVPRRKQKDDFDILDELDRLSASGSRQASQSGDPFRDAGSASAGGRSEVYARESGSRESGGRESGGRDSSRREGRSAGGSTGREGRSAGGSGGRDLGGRDSGGRSDSYAREVRSIADTWYSSEHPSRDRVEAEAPEPKSGNKVDFEWDPLKELGFDGRDEGYAREVRSLADTWYSSGHTSRTGSEPADQSRASTDQNRASRGGNSADDANRGLRDGGAAGDANRGLRSENEAVREGRRSRADRATADEGRGKKTTAAAGGKSRGLGDNFDAYDELKRYEAMRKQSLENSAGGSGSIDRAAKHSGASVSIDRSAKHSESSGYAGGAQGRSAHESGTPSFNYEAGTGSGASNAQRQGGSASSASRHKRAPIEEEPDHELFGVHAGSAVHGARAGGGKSYDSASGDRSNDIGSGGKSYDSVSAASGSKSYDFASGASGSAGFSTPDIEAPNYEPFDSARKGRAPVEEADEPGGLYNAKEIAAIKQASQEAYDRYRSNYTKNRKKKSGRAKVGTFHRVLTAIYAIAVAAFAVSMTIMDVLPPAMLIALYIVLGLLSLLLLVQTRRPGIKKWGRRLASFMAIILVGIYGVGTAYALGTLSFLSSTSVENPKAVANITKDPFNVIITGIDVKGTIDEQGRSDVNMILTVNPATAQILMTSIPRDYEIYMPDKDNAMDKLTHTGFYGIDTTVQAEEQLLDIVGNYYVKVNFTTVEKFIDAIGGIDVYSEYEFNPVKMKDWTVKEGMNHMNGKQALAFARERKAFVTGDHQRIKNQQAVFEAMFKKATSSRTMIFNYSKILANLKDYFEMSFSSREIRSLAKMQLTKFPEWLIYKNTISGGDGTLDTYSAGYAYVMTQDAESIEHAKTLINAVLEGKALHTDEEGVVSVKGETSESESETEAE